MNDYMKIQKGIEERLSSHSFTLFEEIRDIFDKDAFVVGINDNNPDQLSFYFELLNGSNVDIIGYLNENLNENRLCVSGISKTTKRETDLSEYELILFIACAEIAHLEWMKRSVKKPSLTSCSDTLNNIIQYRTTNGSAIRNILHLNYQSVENGSVYSTSVLYGEFKYFKNHEEVLSKSSSLPKNISAIKDKYKIFKNRAFTEEEQKMLESNKTDEFYSPSKNVITMLEKVSKSWDRPEHLRKNNILLEGPTGTGKTKDSMVFADLIGLPYTKITCFSDMDSSDVAGAIYPLLGNKDEFIPPSEADIDFDPEGVYEQLTGDVKDGVTSEEVREVIDNKMLDYYKEEGNTSPEYVYYASEIVKAFENGWVLEIQEPTCIADAAVLLILNSALEKNGVINLPDRIVKRHPDFICIMTTNRDYNGCRPLNQALRNRFNMTRKVELPQQSELVDRLHKATACSDKFLLKEVVRSVLKLNDKISDIGINSTISTRNMMDLVSDLMDGFDIRESVMEDLIWNVTTEDEDVIELVTFLEQSTKIFNISCNK